MGVLRISDALEIAQLNKVIDAIDAGAGAGTIKFYTGAQPATADTAVSGTLLATLTFSNPCEATIVAAGAMTFDSITGDTSADATGDMGYGRVADSDGNTVFDGDVTTVTVGTGVFQFPSVSVTATEPVNLTSFTYTVPSGE